jgi:hypothetical protein
MRTCEHVKTDGQICGSPALRGRRRCFFHYQQKARVDRMEGHPCVPFPLLEDHESIQAAIMQVIDRLNMRTIEYRAAALMLNALKIAAANSKHARFGRDYAEYVTTLPKEDKPKQKRPLSDGSVSSQASQLPETNAQPNISDSDSPNPLSYLVDVTRMRQ